MFHVSLEHGHSVFTMAAVGAVVIGATALLYRRMDDDLPRGRCRILFALRSLALLSVLLLIFRPILSLEKDVRERRGVVFLVDSSASMATTDDPSKISRLDQVRARLLEWHPKLRGGFDLQWLSFADQAHALAGVESLAGLRANGEATSLSRALQAGARQMPRKSIEALVLMSDGIHNAAGNPVKTARALGIPIHTVGVGTSLRNNPSFRDVQVASIDCPPQLTLNNQARIAAQIESVGLTGRVAKVFLEEDGKVVGQTDLALNSGSAPQDVAFQFLPTSQGRHSYTVRVAHLAEEAIQQNNQRSALAQVVEVRIRVLYLEGALRAEYGALVERFLSKDPDIEFCALVQTRQNVFVQRTNMKALQLSAIPSDPAILDKFNVFVLGDLDISVFKTTQLDLLVKRVRDGAGLVMLGGYNSLGPGGYGGSVLEAILPLTLGDRKIGQLTEPFLPQLPAEGRNHVIFAGIGKFFPSPSRGPEVAGLPPLRGCVKVVGARPGATVLAIHSGDDPGTSGTSGTSAGMLAKAMPILAVQPVGKGRSAVFTGDTTRNWHQILRAQEQESPFVRFWGQLVRWLANRTEAIKGEPSVTARTDKVYYEPDSAITITAMVRDKEGEGVNKAQVKARVKLSQGKEEISFLALSANATGQYQVIYEPKRAGTHEIIVEARVGEASLSAEKMVVDVGRPNLEYDRLDLDDRLLMQIAEVAGGRYQHISTADRLIDELQRKEEKRRVYLEQPLYFPAAYWVVFAVALVSEWALRKRYRLR